MRLYETGTKELSRSQKDASQYFKASFDLWSLFFAINLKLIDVRKIDSKEITEEGRKMGKFSELMKKIIDCCKEW